MNRRPLKSEQPTPPKEFIYLLQSRCGQSIVTLGAFRCYRTAEKAALSYGAMNGLRETVAHGTRLLLTDRTETLAVCVTECELL